MRGEHIHEPKFSKPEARRVIAEIKARSEQLTPSVAVSSSILPMTNEYATQLSLPSKGSLIQMSRRKRRDNNLVEEINPINRQFTLPESLRDFLIADTGSEDLERILVFGDKDLVNLLQASKQWLADGTFKLSPTLFYQLYTIHAQVGHSAPACVYALLPNKSEKTYSRMIELISPSMPDASPSRILLDFEQAPMNAFQKFFISAQMSGCYFHLCQSLNRRINELCLIKVYENKPELALALRCLPALAFEDKGKVKGSFSLVIDDITEVCDSQDVDMAEIEKIDELCCYFQKTYIEGPRRPLFPPNIWNQREAAFEGIARTTNSVEGWHFGLQAYFTGAHSTIWQLLAALKKDAASQKLRYLQTIAGQPELPRKKYRDLNEKVQKIMAHYNEGIPLPFLRSIAALTV